MHWCPYCNQPCYCDSDDTDYGKYECDRHNEIACATNIDDEELDEQLEE